jgi:phage portal protein BeeE
MAAKYKAITQIPGWADLLEQGDKVTSAPRSYDTVPLIKRAVGLRCNSLAGVPMHLYKGDNEVDWMFESSLERLIWQTEAALLLTGGAYWLKASNQVIVKDVKWLNPLSVEVQYENGEYYFIQRAGSQVNEFSSEEIVYFREFDITQDTHPGVADAGVSLGDAQLQHYMTRFAWHFFEGGAMPVTVVGMEQVSETERKRVEGVFRRMLSSVANAFRVVGVRADAVDLKTLTPPIKDLAMPDLYAQAKKNIGNAFGIPVTLLEDPSANRATSITEHYSFWAETVRPRRLLYEDVINTQLLGAGGIEIKFAFEEMDIFQEDENQRANSLKTLVDAGIPLVVAMEILGYDLSPETQKMLDDLLAEKAERANQLTQQLTGGQSSDDDDDEDEQKGFRAELSKWKRNAISRLESGRNPARMFKSDFIPEHIAKRIFTMLRMTRTKSEITAVFDSFMRLETDETPEIGELVDALKDATVALAEYGNNG